MLCHTVYFQQYQTLHIWPKSRTTNHLHWCQVQQLRYWLGTVITGFVHLNIWSH
jgi:hypothetical protein